MTSTCLLNPDSENHFQKVRSKETHSFKENRKVEESIADIVTSLTSEKIKTIFTVIKSFNAQVSAITKRQNPSIFETAPKKVEAILVEPKKVTLTKVDVKVNAALSVAVKTKNPSVFGLPTKPVVSKQKYDLNTEIQKASLIRDIKKAKASVEVERRVPGSTPPPSNDDIFLRFMALLRRMYNQSQEDANDLYKKVKERTDQIDMITKVTTQANLGKGDVDWSQDEKMKAMLDYAIDHCGLNWERGKYVIPAAEIPILKENLHAAKDSMERFSKLDQPKMQQKIHVLNELIAMLSNTAKTWHDTMMGLIANLKN